MIVTIFEIAAIVLMIIMVVSQIWIPCVRGTMLFPIFRREAELLKELEERKQRNRERAIEKQIKKEKQK